MDQVCAKFKVSHPTVYRWQQSKRQGLRKVTIVTKDHRGKAETRVYWDVDTDKLAVGDRRLRRSSGKPTTVERRMVRLEQEIEQLREDMAAVKQEVERLREAAVPA